MLRLVYNGWLSVRLNMFGLASDGSLLLMGGKYM